MHQRMCECCVHQRMHKCCMHQRMHVGAPTLVILRSQAMSMESPGVVRWAVVTLPMGADKKPGERQARDLTSPNRMLLHRQISEYKASYEIMSAMLPIRGSKNQRQARKRPKNAHWGGGGEGTLPERQVVAHYLKHLQRRRYPSAGMPSPRAPHGPCPCGSDTTGVTAAAGSCVGVILAAGAASRHQ